MQMEAEVLAMMTLGFVGVVLVSIGVIISLWVKTKNKAYSWFLVQVAFLIIAFINFTGLLIGSSSTPETMLSEENSLLLGIVGVFWALSMLFMLIGIYRLGRTKTKDALSSEEKEEYNAKLVKVIGMLTFYSVVCPIIPFLIARLAALIMGFSPDDPIVYVFTTVSSFSLLILWLKRKYTINLKSMFSLEKISVLLFIPMALTVTGMIILLSEVDNFIRIILPMNDLWLNFFSTLLGDGFAPWKGFLAVVVTAPIVEEILMRGLVLRSFLKHYSVRKSIILSALLFGILHLNPWQFVTAFISGLLLGWLYVKTNSIVTTIFAHALNNAMGFILGAIDLSIPGLNTVYDSAVHQPLWFNSLGIILLAFGMVWLVKMFKGMQLSPEEVSIVSDEI